MRQHRTNDEFEERMEVLSAYLASCLKEVDEEAENDDREAGLVVEKLIRSATSSLEGFAPVAANQVLQFWKANPENWKWAADEFYSRQCVASIPRIVHRFLELTPVLVGRVPSSEVSLYLREATQCFLHGFFQASTALSRAALEAGVNELLDQRLGAVPAMDLVEKLNQLERFKLLDATTARKAHDVRKAGGTVLHQSPAPEKLAFHTILNAREVLMKLYAK